MRCPDGTHSGTPPPQNRADGLRMSQARDSMVGPSEDQRNQPGERRLEPAHLGHLIPMRRGQQPSACQLTVWGPDGDVMVTPVGVGFA